MFSVIVPTHEPRYLRQALDSVLAQTRQDFEIVVVPNGDASLDGVLPSDARIRVVPYDGPPGRIGAIKRFGFEAALGDALVELDHDDLLTPDCLEVLGGVFDKGKGIDFAYSSTAHFRNDWTSKVYSPNWGWKSREVEAFGRKLTEMIAFPPLPASVCYVWWSANHVRAWTKDGYKKSGGHDTALSVGDDHDVVIRTYLSGKVERIDKCLYLQREHEGNTTKTLATNRVIQKTTKALYAKHIRDIVKRWCDLEGLPAYDLGGAHGLPPGWQPVDMALGGPDLRERWPWESGSVGAFRAFDFLEHLPDKMHTLSEMHRCLAPGGWALTYTPSALGRGAFQDPTHCSYWVARSFKYVTDRNLAKYVGNTTVRFQEMRLIEDEPYELAGGRVVQSKKIPYVTADLVALKDGYEGPGLVSI